MNIAVVGCGIAGAAVAGRLAAQGHSVTLWERAETCGPVGAGLLLQPSGQAILSEWGLLGSIAATSSVINELHAKLFSGKTLVNVAYRRADPRCFGYGVHRGLLFKVLYDECVAKNVDIRNGVEAATYHNEGNGVELRDAHGTQLGKYDLLIASDGSNSALRQSSSLASRSRDYDYAALWTVGQCETQPDKLLQIVGGTTRLVGLLPIGQGNCSFFWGLHKSDWPHLREGDFSKFQTMCKDFAPEASELIDGLSSMDEMTYSGYRTVSMPRVVDGRVVFIGDAAHATSPHLGQGANLALADAHALAKAVGEGELSADLMQKSLATYELERRRINRFYGRLTGWLSPFFQSGSVIRGWGRDMALPWLPHLPWFGHQMALTMAGMKTGWLTARPLGDAWPPIPANSKATIATNPQVESTARG